MRVVFVKCFHLKNKDSKQIYESIKRCHHGQLVVNLITSRNVKSECLLRNQTDKNNYLLVNNLSLKECQFPRLITNNYFKVMFN